MHLGSLRALKRVTLLSMDKVGTVHICCRLLVVNNCVNHFRIFGTTQITKEQMLHELAQQVNR